MDSLKDLLLEKNLDQPSQMKSINEFLLRKLEFSFELKDYPNHITISVGSGKIAYLVRSLIPEINAYAAPTKNIHVRIESRLLNS